MAELIINEPGTYDGHPGPYYGDWETYEYVEVNASPVTLKHYIISSENYFTLLEWRSGGGSLTIEQCIFSGKWPIDNYYGGGNLIIRDCAFSCSLWAINTSGSTVTVVNNLFNINRDWLINSWGDSLTFINNTIIGGWSTNVFNLMDSSLTFGNNILCHDFGNIFNATGCSFSIRTNLKFGDSSWYSDQEVPTGNLILADPLLVSMSDYSFRHRYKPYPNGYFLNWGSPAIDAGEEVPYGCLGTTALDSSPDTNTIDLGFHYPLRPPGWIEIAVAPLFWGPIREIWDGRVG